MILKEIILKDSLKHHRYNWPETLVKYPLSFELGEVLDEANISLCLGELSIPFQLEDIKRENEHIVSATICFVTDLPMGAEYTFILSYNQQACNKQVNDYKILNVLEKNEKSKVDNSWIYFETENEGEYDLSNLGASNCINLLTFGSTVGDVKGYFKLYSTLIPKNYIIRNKVCGEVSCQREIVVNFENGQIYKLKVCITDKMEFIEIEEDISGFDDSESVSMCIEWDGIEPEKRYTKFRKEEKIDCYNDKGGKLPFKVMPYRNWDSWWHQKYATFTDSKKNLTASICIKDAEKWDDGEYALWGSSNSLAISFCYKSDMFSEKNDFIWECPVKNGKRAFIIALYDSKKESESEILSYTEELWLWYGLLNLNKVKGWILDWEEPKEQFPRFFHNEKNRFNNTELWFFYRDSMPEPSDLMQIIEKLSYSFNNLSDAGPVSSREFTDAWIPLFDITAPKMTTEQFDRAKAVCAFVAYAYMDENIMPVRNLLSGHPNFLVDIIAPVGYMAGLFPNHPHAKTWLDYFEVATARNLKYHTRPDVDVWGATGGRWTENLGCYVWAMLKGTVCASALIHETWGEVPCLHPNLSKLANWLINSLSAPVKGDRTYPPQGAHSGANNRDPIYPNILLRELGQLIHRYDPIMSEYLLSVCKMKPINKEQANGGIWNNAILLGDYENNSGTKPMLKSEKFTGYGYLMRSAVGTPGEMSVYLQQIDEGPNYRWGRAGNGGNGVIYYYADGKRYSFNNPEDVGDENRGDVQACTNFGVLVDDVFRSVGRNDLTEPLYNFDFAQYARINADEIYAPFYKYRSVMMCENDYIVIFDAVTDMRVAGRFSWFVKDCEGFPEIFQVKPGANAVNVDSGIPFDKNPDYKSKYKPSKGKVFDGKGDFLTVVTHRIAADYQKTFRNAKKTSYGAEIDLAGRKDYVFSDSCLIKYCDESKEFVGYAGILKIQGKKIEAAIFNGKKIGNREISLELKPKSPVGNSHMAISFIKENNHINGKCHIEEDATVFIKLAEVTCNTYSLFVNGLHEKIETNNGLLIFSLPKGLHKWEITDKKPMIIEPQIKKTVVSARQVRIEWELSNGADAYQIAVSNDNEENFNIVGETSDSSYTVTELNNECKLHFRVRGINCDRFSDWSPSYPVYVTTKVPLPPDGLRIWKNDSNYNISWGKMLGIECYRLYGISDEGVSRLIYEGDQTKYYSDGVSGTEHYVTSVNGNGESEPSLKRSTADIVLTEWDPRPNEKFRRDTKGHEYGFDGIDHWENEQKKIIKYPNNF